MNGVCKFPCLLVASKLNWCLQHFWAPTSEGSQKSIFFYWGLIFLSADQIGNEAHGQLGVVNSCDNWNCSTERFWRM